MTFYEKLPQIMAKIAVRQHDLHVVEPFLMASRTSLDDVTVSELSFSSRDFGAIEWRTRNCQQTFWRDCFVNI